MGFIDRGRSLIVWRESFGDSADMKILPLHPAVSYFTLECQVLYNSHLPRRFDWLSFVAKVYYLRDFTGTSKLKYLRFRNRTHEYNDLSIFLNPEHS